MSRSGDPTEPGCGFGLILLGSLAPLPGCLIPATILGMKRLIADRDALGTGASITPLPLAMTHHLNLALSLSLA